MPRGAGASGALIVVLEAAGCGRRAKRGFELVDCEFATKVARKDGRESKLAVAWKVEVLTIIDARGTGKKLFSIMESGCTTKSLSPDRDILGNVIRRSRVGEKCCGFVLVVEGASVTHRPF